MKKLIISIAIILFRVYSSYGQLTLDHVYTTDAPGVYVKLSLSGLKYLSINKNASGSNTYFKLYNSDHSVFKTITIPQFPGKNCNTVEYVSETLFDTDTLVEYIAQYVFNGGGGIGAVRVCNENGVILLQRDTAGAGGLAGLLENGRGGQVIFPDGNNTKLIIGKANYAGGWIYTTEIYDLPGQLACLECDNGVVSGLAAPSNIISDQKNALAYPNPFTDKIKIKYYLPINVNRAFINLFDITGNLIKKKEIDSHFNEIIITSDEIKQGAYIYQIVADDKVIANDKIIKL